VLQRRREEVDQLLDGRVSEWRRDDEPVRRRRRPQRGEALLERLAALVKAPRQAAERVVCVQQLVDAVTARACGAARS
jgi:hypothetical protein